MSLGASFRRLWSGNASANLADGIAFVSIPLVATSLTASPTLIAGLAFVYSLVRVLVVVPVGVIIDRVDRRLILWISNLARGGLVMVLSVTFAVGWGSLPLLYVVWAMVGILETAADNAALSVLPSVVAERDLDRANGRIATAQLVADEFAGPPLGGFLFAIAVALPVAVTGGLYAAAALLFMALPRHTTRFDRREVPAARSSMWREAAQGVAWIRGHRLLSGLAITGGLASAAYMMTFSILVLYATDILGLGPTGYGVILAVSSLGGLLGAVIAAPLREAIGYAWTIPASLALGSVTMGGLFFTTSPRIAAALLAAYILHVTIWNVCAVSLRQRLVPEWMRGRQNSLVKLTGTIGLVLGAAVAGPLAATFGLAAPFGVAGVLFAICVAFTAWIFATDPDR